MSSAEEPLSTSEVCRKIQGALDNMSRSLRCPVCQSTMVADSIVLSKCNHAYCRPCIERCLKEKRLCPVCHQKCHPRRSLTEDPRLAALGRQTVALYRHFGLAPVHHLESKPMMTQLSPEHDERRLTTVHRTLQVSRTFRKALPSQEDALQEIVTANEKALLKVVTGRRDQHPECCQVQDKKPAAAEDAKKSDEKTPSQTNTKAESSMEEEPAGASGDADIVQKVEAEGDLFHQSKLGENRARGRFGKRNNDVQLVQPLGHILTTEDKAVPAEVTVHNTSSPQVTSQVSEHTQPILNDQESTKSPLPTTPEVTTKQTAKATSDSESDDDDWVAVIQQANPQEQTPLTKPASEKKTHTSTSEETSHTVANPQGESPTAGSHEFKVGDIVNVQARTWPGMNKPGGTARVTGLVANGYNVAYILGSRERNVDTSFVSAPLDVKPRSRGKTELSCQVLQELEAQGFGLHQQRRVGTDAASAPVSVKAKKKRPAQKLVGDSDKKRSRQTVDVSQIPEWTTEEMYALADAWYQECLAKGFKNKVMHVVATNLSDKCMKAMKRLEKESQIWEVQVKLTAAVNCNTNLCVTSTVTNSDGAKIPTLRTMKTMKAAIHGIPIVGEEWIGTCRDQHSVSMRLPFIRTLRGENGLAFTAAALSHTSGQYKPFSHCKVAVDSSLSDVGKVLRLAGGAVVSPKLATIRVCKDKGAKGAVDPSWVYDSVSQGKPLPRDTYSA